MVSVTVTIRALAFAFTDCFVLKFVIRLCFNKFLCLISSPFFEITERNGQYLIAFAFQLPAWAGKLPPR